MPTRRVRSSPRSRFVSCLACLVCLFALPVAGRAAPVVDFTGGEVIGFGDMTLGWSFTANSPLQITALGMWDEDADGLMGSNQVGLWTASGTLLAQVAVNAASDPVASTSGDGQWLFTDITPLILATGEVYVVGAYYGGPLICIRGECSVVNGDSFRFNASLATHPGVTFIEARGASYSAGGSPNPLDHHISFPDGVGPVDNGYFGPNLIAADVTAVPEPASLMLVGSGLAMLYKRRFRRRSDR